MNSLTKRALVLSVSPPTNILIVSQTLIPRLINWGRPGIPIFLYCQVYHPLLTFPLQYGKGVLPAPGESNLRKLTRDLDVGSYLAENSTISSRWSMLLGIIAFWLYILDC